MYRCVTLACHESGTSVSDTDAVAELARGLDIAFATAEDGSQHVTIDGKDVTSAIRTAEVDADVSAVSAIPAVREAMVAQQRTLAGTHDVVAEGRDIGTVVFPNAEVKVYLTADAEARAHRRAVQREGGDAATDAQATADAAAEAQILADIKARDAYDSSREASPLKPAEDAVHIDSSSLSVDEVVARVEALMEAAR
jgi:cytidylate kinase